MLFTSRDKRTGAYATTVSAYGFIKLKNFLTTEEVDELKTELENEICRTSNLFHKRQLEIQREYLDHDGVGNMELIMVPKVFVSEPKENTSYISLMVALPVREHVFSSSTGVNLLLYISIPSHAVLWYALFYLRHAFKYNVAFTAHCIFRPT